MTKKYTIYLFHVTNQAFVVTTIFFINKFAKTLSKIGTKSKVTFFKVSLPTFLPLFSHFPTTRTLLISIFEVGQSAGAAPQIFRKDCI